MHIYWYGLFMILAIIAALLVTIKIAAWNYIKKDLTLDLSFYLIIGSLLGARIYEIFLEWPYYSQNPLDIFKIWQGGLAIHGAIIAGLLIVALFSYKNKLSFWTLVSVIVPGLALGQAIGRWGNYFNQELFGLPTALPWGIPIEIINRPLDFISSKYFQPTFLYESLGSLLIFLILLTIHVIIRKRRKTANLPLDLPTALKISTLYLILYSSLRFFLEFIRIDHAPLVNNWRWPQIASIIIIAISILLIAFHKHAKKNPESK